jgi:hypothetical protein
MRIFKDITNADFITQGSALNVNLVEYSLGTSSDLLDYSTESAIFNNYELPQIDKFTSEDPYFVILKIYKPKNVSSIVFKSGTDNLYEVKFTDKRKDMECILRLIDSDGTTPESIENFIHKNNESAHLSEVHSILLGTSEKSLINTNLVDNLYNSNKSKSINSTLITKELQLFYMGNLISDSDEFINE